MQQSNKLLSQEWLDFVNEYLKKERIQVRDAEHGHEDDSYLKIPKRFVLSGSVVLSANSLSFFQCKRTIPQQNENVRPKSVRFAHEDEAVTSKQREPLRSILKTNKSSLSSSSSALMIPLETALLEPKPVVNPDKGWCKCKWKSSLCSYQFDYEVFRIPDTRGGVKHSSSLKKPIKIRYFLYLKAHVLL